jgi:hypothetical protein
VSESDQLVLDRGAESHGAERAMRRTLRAQVARLERELSAIVAERFPYISATAPAEHGPLLRRGDPGQMPAPSLLGLEELERTRDHLAGRLQRLRRLATERDKHERRAHEQLARMKLEPGRFKFMRIPVSDLGQGGCGVWHVRPRLGLIGMLAGWWQVKLSSGCPLPRGSRSRRGPEQRR